MAPVVRGVQVFSQGSVFDAQKNNLKEAAGGTFRFVALTNFIYKHFHKTI